VTRSAGSFQAAVPVAASDLRRADAALPEQRSSPGIDPPAEAPEGAAAGAQPAPVLLIDPDLTAAQSLVQALAAIGITDVATAANVEAATEIVPASQGGAATGAMARPGPHGSPLAIVSLRLATEVPSAIALLSAAGWNRIIALSTTAAISDVTAALAAGATGAVVAGRAAPTRNVPTGIYDLSPREVEVLRMVADGRSNKWIGERLDLSALTVKSHLARIGRKLGTGDRAHMVTLALRAGVIH
jgi:DNA-binding NarL/FixJ family response regulator